MAGLSIRMDICTGCMNCQTVCALSRADAQDKFASAIRVNLQLFSGRHTHTYCRQCTKPACREVCVVNAISLNSETGAWIVSDTLCVKCGRCVDACPNGAMFLKKETTVPFKCDLCGGNPVCVEACTFNAI
ncbi:MAG: 4Fe-4S dicluster domain-containing protein, partial [bacterium]|nr:4Fe-4S dicluster domain-containing protein [bacterium]